MEASLVLEPLAPVLDENISPRGGQHHHHHHHHSEGHHPHHHHHHPHHSLLETVLQQVEIELEKPLSAPSSHHPPRDEAAPPAHFFAAEVQVPVTESHSPEHHSGALRVHVTHKSMITPPHADSVHPSPHRPTSSHHDHSEAHRSPHVDHSHRDHSETQRPMVSTSPHADHYHRPPSGHHHDATTPKLPPTSRESTPSHGRTHEPLTPGKGASLLPQHRLALARAQSVASMSSYSSSTFASSDDEEDELDEPMRGDQSSPTYFASMRIIGHHRSRAQRLSDRRSDDKSLVAMVTEAIVSDPQKEAEIKVDMDWLYDDEAVTVADSAKQVAPPLLKQGSLARQASGRLAGDTEDIHLSVDGK